MKKIYIVIIAMMLVLGLSMQAQATLTTIGTATYNSSNYNLIYDDDLGITWLDYSNPVYNWQSQVNWAAGLNTSGVLTYNLNPGVTMSWSGDWRLPTTLQPDLSCSSGVSWGYNCTGSEMGHLFYGELGGTALISVLNSGDPDLALFTNLQPGVYWSGTEYVPDPNYAWYFYFGYGFQLVYDKGGDFYALAVRSGHG